MKYIKISHLVILTSLISCTQITQNKELSRIRQIGIDEPLIEILIKNTCSYPLYVNGLPDSLKVEQLYPNPCSPGYIRTFIFRVEDEAIVNIKIEKQNSVLVLLNKSMPKGYFILDFPGIDSNYIAQVFPDYNETGVMVDFTIGDKKYRYSLF